MNPGRALIGGTGCLCAGYGVWLLWTRSSAEQLRSTLVWLAGGVVLHDLVLAPLVVGLGVLATRLLSPTVRGPAAAGLIVLGGLTVMAIPVLGAWGRRPDNPTLLDRAYLAGWLAVAGLAIVGVVLGVVVRWRMQSGGSHGERARRGRRSHGA